MAPRLWNAAAAAASEEPPPTSSAHEYDFAAAEREGVEAAARARFAAEAPPEVLAGVLSWLAPHALASVACASRAFRDLAHHDDVWRFACEGCRRWPGRPVHGSYRASVVVQAAVDANWSRHRFKRLVSHTHSRLHFASSHTVLVATRHTPTPSPPRPAAACLPGSLTSQVGCSPR